METRTILIVENDPTYSKLEEVWLINEGYIAVHFSSLNFNYTHLLL